jgi:hypothetical protein
LRRRRRGGLPPGLAGGDSDRRGQEKRQRTCFHGAGDKFYNPDLEPALSHGRMWEGTHMKWMNIYFIGFLVFLTGVGLALWKAGIIESIGTTWTLIGFVIAIGIGIMLSVANSGEKKTIEVDRT